jgi:hypothetical protein
MFRFAGIALFAVSAFAQPSVMPPEPPPPGVDEALRARIQEFYGYFISEQYRKAEKLVAEDSQDWFYDHNKPHYLSIEIRRIEYSDHFTRANVLTLCEQQILMIGFNGPMKIPTPSTWKLVDGQWFWYIDKDEISKTPFGKMPVKESGKPSSASTSLPTIPATPDFALNRVRPESKSLQVKAGESAEDAITNTAPGPVTLSIYSKPPGVEAKLDHELVSAGQKAVLSVHAAAGARPGRIVLKVHETAELIPIELQIN